MAVALLGDVMSAPIAPVRECGCWAVFSDPSRVHHGVTAAGKSMGLLGLQGPAKCGGTDHVFAPLAARRGHTLVITFEQWFIED